MGLGWIELDWIGLGVSEWVLSAVSDGLRGGGVRGCGKRDRGRGRGRGR